MSILNQNISREKVKWSLSHFTFKTSNLFTNEVVFTIGKATFPYHIHPVFRTFYSAIVLLSIYNYSYLYIIKVLIVGS